MEILMVTAELAQVSPSGDVGDCVASLSRSLSQLGHAVTVAMPKPAAFENSGIMVARRLTPLALQNGTSATVYDGQLASGVSVVLFEAQGLQSESVPEEDLAEQERLSAAGGVILCQAAAALAQQRASAGKPFDVIHGHDASGAMIPFTGLDIPTLLTVYDARDQGLIGIRELEAFGLDLPTAAREMLKLGARFSTLKGGMLAADVLAGASPSYAETLTDVEQFGSFAEALKADARELHGVLGGVDYATQNPATDSALATRYDAEAPAGKGSCKTALCRELELELEPDLPLVCWVGRLDKETGSELMLSLLPSLLKLPINLVVAGSGPKAIVKLLSAAKLKRSPNFRFIETTSSADIRRTLAAADVALCPQRSATTGRAARVAQRFGAVPVALNVPGSRDSIVTCDPELKTGTGFLASGVEADSLLAAVEAAVAATATADWWRLRRRVMRQDLSWERPARRYVQLYRLAATA
jgi:starch synthase